MFTVFFLQKLSAIVIGTGSIFSFIFHVGTKETPGRVLNESPHQNGTDFSEHQQMSWKDWFREPQFYLVSVQNI